jgi:hypothetical protein
VLAIVLGLLVLIWFPELSLFLPRRAGVIR